MSPFKTVLGLLSPAGGDARLSILIFHRVRAEPDPLFPAEMHAAQFARVLGWLRQWFNVLSLEEAVRRLGDGSLPPRPAVITFDDGYADNCTVATPLLADAGLTATFFIATGYVDGGRMWNDTLIEAVRGARQASLDVRDIAPALASLPPVALDSWAARKQAAESLIGQCKYLPAAERQSVVNAVAERSGAALPRNLMMTSEQLRDIRRQGMGIGAHTVTHPILATLEDEVARGEMLDSKQWLEGLLDERIAFFAYPNGKPHEDYSEATVRLARECGFDAAVSTAHGVSVPDTDLFQLPRFTPWGNDRARFGLRMALNTRRPVQRTNG